MTLAVIYLIGTIYGATGRWELLLLYIGILCYIGYGAVTKKGKLWCIGVLLCLLLLFLIAVYREYAQEEFRNAYLSQIENGKEAVVWGRISKKEYKKDNCYYILTDCVVCISEKEYRCNRVLSVFSSDGNSIGDIIKIKGKLNNFQCATNYGMFDQRAYYLAQKIDFEVRAATILGSCAAKFQIQESLFRFRCQLLQNFLQLADEKTAGILSSMLLGDKRALDLQIKSLYQAVGIGHILAISGLHVSVFGMGLYRLIRNRGGGFWLSGLSAGIVLCLYVRMTGAAVSSVRAAGMLLLLLGAELAGRSYDLLNALGGVTLLLLASNPFLIFYAGFWFSVAAVAGIGISIDKISSTEDRQVQKENINSGFKKNVLACLRKKWEKGTKSMWTALSVQLVTLPLTAYFYYEIPTYALILNCLLLPVVSVILVSGTAGGLVSLCSTAVAGCLLLPAKWLLSIYERVCNFFLRLPYASIIAGKPSLERLEIYYAVYLLGLSVLYAQAKKNQTQGHQKAGDQTAELRKGKKRFQAVCRGSGKMIWLCMLVGILLFPKTHHAEVTVLDVGQGDGIYLCTEGGTSLFIDGGSSDVQNVGTYRILPFLKAKGIREIPYWFLSHLDEDHVSGLEEALEAGYRVGAILLADRVPRDEAFEKLSCMAYKNKIHIVFLKKGQYLQIDAAKITCLYAGADAFSERNDQSLVLGYEENGFSAVFAGDISAEVETHIIESNAIKKVTFYKGVHHGSKNSNSAGFLEILKPDIVTISCGAYNRYGHPHKETLERIRKIGASCYRTDQSGAITIIREKGRLRIVCGEFYFAQKQQV